MGIKINKSEISTLVEDMIGYDCCQVCEGIEECGKQKILFEDSIETICTECLEKLEGFEKWIQDGNVIRLPLSDKEVYCTQDAQYKNRLKGVNTLVEYYKKEFLK